ncbi:MAG: hypothetical protein ABW186_10345 [Rhodanobacteraceae bacterium]
MSNRTFWSCSVRAALVAWMLIAMPIARAAPFAYISNQTDGTVSVIDTATGTVATTLPVGPTPLGVAVNSAGTRAYVANLAGQSVSVIDTVTNTVIDLIPVAGTPEGIAVSADGSRVYAVGGEPGLVFVIDTATDTVTATIPVGRAPRSVAVNLAGTRVYVGNSDDNTHGHVTVIDAATNAIITTIEVLGEPWGILVDPSGRRVYTSHHYSDSVNFGRVTVIDTQTNTVIATPTVPGGSFGIAMNPAGSRIYVTNTNFNSSVSVLDAHCNEVISNIPLPMVAGEARALFGISVAPDGAHVYVATRHQNTGFNSVAVIDAATQQVVGDIPVGDGPWAVGTFISPGVVVAPPAGAPIRVTSIELTQGIQDIANDVLLVSGKRTFARVHVKSDAADIPNVTASLSGLGSYLDGGGGVVQVALGPLVPSNRGGPRISVKANPKRNVVDDSFVFELPWNWTAFDNLRVAATLSEPGAPPPSGSCMSDLEDGPGADISMSTHIKVAFVRMGYAFPGAGTERTSSSEQLQTESWMRRAYPLAELNATPDFELFDAALGSWVERTAIECVIGFAEDDRNLCAHAYTTARLGALYATTTLFGFPDGHLIDDIDVVYGLIPQHFIGASPEPYFTRGACCTNSVGAGPANDDDYASHEIGHFLGRMHPVEGASECGHSASDPDYPYFLSFIAPPLADPEVAMAGFDGGDASLSKPMRVLPASGTFDIMGYCDPVTWISDYTYRWLFICLEALNQGGITAGCPNFGAGAPDAKPLAHRSQSGDWLLVYGLIAADRAHAALIDVERTDGIFSEPPRTPGDFSIQLVGDAGAVLADYPFTPTASADVTASGGLPLGFGQAVPFVAGTREVHIVDVGAGNAVLASKAVSSNAPVVTSVAVQAATGPTLTLTWAASDADGDALHYDVLVSRADGATLQPLALGMTQTSLDIDSTTLAGGAVTFRVVASDGLLTAHADSNAITLANQPPRPRVLSPGNGEHVTRGEIVNLEGVAKDLQDDTLPDANLAWSSSSGALGTGARLSVADLPAGPNTLTLTATNSVGLSATSSVVVFVDADPVVLGPTLSIGPTQIGWHVAAGETGLQTAELDIANRGSGALAFTISSGASWLSASVTNGTAPATLTLTANPTGLGDGAILDTQLTIAVVGMPSQTIVVPVRLAVGNTFDVGNGAPAVTDSIYANGFDNPG